MSDTPRTDALLESWPSTLDTQGDADKMQAMVSLARDLERSIFSVKDHRSYICQCGERVVRVDDLTAA